MNNKLWLLIVAVNFSICLTASASVKEFSSASEATELIELYTSEGCSSCPPADKWMRQLKSDPDLFKKFIPLSFHVDYWNGLGWTDRFSKRKYTDRQYQHHKEGNISQVYTPGFVVNNQEWRNWRLSNFFQWPDNQQPIGVLKVSFDQSRQKLIISFNPESAIIQKKLNINIAILGMGLSSDVRLGENRGRQLKHDFVVLKHNLQRVSLSSNPTQTWQIDTPVIPDLGQNQNALVVWLTNPASQRVIQATGGYL